MVHLPPVSYPSPLTGYEDAPPLPTDKNEDGSLKNEQTGVLSSAYDKFVEPLDAARGGFDVHIYFDHLDPAQVQYARELHARVRREFPELRTGRMWGRPIGPHLRAFFEVNPLTPVQFGAFVAWLAIWRGPLSVLVHPNTVEPGVSEADAEVRNHSDRAIWMGPPLEVNLDVLTKMAGDPEAFKAAIEAAAEAEGV